MEKKINFKKFVKEYSYEIGFAIGTTVLIGTGAWWLWHVKRNTTELPKLDIPSGKCHEHYLQFGKHYMSAECEVGGVSEFVKGLLEAGHFGSGDKMFFMVTDDQKLFK